MNCRRLLFGSVGGLRPHLLWCGLAALTASSLNLPFQLLQGESEQELKANLDLPYNAASARDDGDLTEALVFYGTRLDGGAFFFCIDVSLSLGLDGWASLSSELRRSIQDLEEEVEIGLVFFAESSLVFPPDGRPVKATASAKGRAFQVIDQVKPGQGTCLAEGLRKTLELARASNAEKKVIVLLTDGKPTCPGTDFVTYREGIFTLPQAIGPPGVEIHTLAFGDNVDESFLRRLAEENRGSFRRIPSH